MKASEVYEALVGYTVAHCGHDPQRGYLGMSQISKCPRRVFFEVRDGTEAGGSELLFYKGYQMQYDLLQRLALALEETGATLVVGDEVGELSALGDLFRGHPDGELRLADGEAVLIEVKSVLQGRLDRIASEGWIPTKHYWQVQCYLHFGGWERAFVIYEARDSGRLYVHEVQRDERTGERIEKKAQLLVEALEKGEAPECRCGRCK